MDTIVELILHPPKLLDVLTVVLLTALVSGLFWFLAMFEAEPLPSTLRSEGREARTFTRFAPF